MEKPGIFVYAVPGQRKALIEVARELDRRGFPFLYASHGSAPAIEPEASSEGVVRPYEGTAVWQDALTHALALGMATERISLVTAIEVTYHRMPHEMAAIANYINEVCDGRFILGIGPGHSEILSPFQVTMEKPLAHMRRYVEAMRASVGNGPMPPLVFAALRQKMVALAGELADGVIWANCCRSQLGRSLSVVPAAKRERFIVGDVAPAYVSEDRGEALAAVRLALTNYMTLRNYQNYFIECGYGDEVEQARAAIARDDHAAVAAAVSERMADDIGIYGTPADVRKRVAAFQEAGMNQLCLSTMFHSRDQAKAIMRVAAAFD